MSRPALSPDELRRTARLARIGLSGGESDELTDDLSQILGFAESVSKSIPTGQDQSAGDAHPAVLRDDILRPPTGSDVLEGRAPRISSGHVVVPRVL